MGSAFLRQAARLPLTAFLMFGAAFLGAICGMWTGWGVGLMWGDNFAPILAKFGGVKLWEFTAFIGFVGGFLASFMLWRDDHGHGRRG